VGSHGELGRDPALLEACDAGASRCARTPLTVSELRDIKSVAVGETSTCVLSSSGALLCFGRGDRGQLGNGALTDQFEPQAVQGSDGKALVGVRLVAVGAFHACAALEAGGVSCWGEDTVGELGRGAAVPANCGDVHCEKQALPVKGLEQVKIRELVAGRDFTCAVRDEDGALLCWGANANGQLGQADTAPRNEPTLVADLEIVQIDAGVQHVCVRTAPFDEVFCWGRNQSDESGAGRPMVALEPAKVYGSAEASQVATGTFHSCALVANGVHCWGENAHGELGRGNTQATGIPEPVAW
jgi:alpha-tubulin suppressor-like RCC1 family protein